MAITLGKNGLKRVVYRAEVMKVADRARRPNGFSESESEIGWVELGCGQEMATQQFVIGIEPKPFVDAFIRVEL